jgi:hypothetical protein
LLGIHSDLRPYVSKALVLSTAVGIAGAMAVAFGLPMIRGAVGPPNWPFVIFGVVSLLCGYLGVVIVPRWYRRSSTIVSTAVPGPGRILLQIQSDSESTSLYGTVLGTSAPQSRIGLLSPAWSVEPFLGTPLDVSIYVDPVSQRPVAFRTPQGLIWCMPWPGPAERRHRRATART